MDDVEAPMSVLSSPTRGAPAPVADSRRIDDIDVLRAMALCGVLVSNLVEVFRVPWATDYDVPGSGRIDAVVGFLMRTAFQGTTITFTFSLMFGLGMAISSERVVSAAASAYRFLVRKQLVLLVLGLVHATLIWSGDILVSYAMVGLAFLPFLRCRPRTLVVVALLAVIVFVLPILPIFPTFTPAQAAARVAAQLEGYQRGSWLQVHAQRIAELKLNYLIHVHWWMVELSAFCLGAAIWHSGILKAPEKHRRALWIALLLGVISLAVICGARTGFLPRWRTVQPPLRQVLLFAYLLAYFELSLAYCAGILLLLQTSLWRRWLLLVVPLGQMSLSNYLMQSIVFGFVFYGYGLGQFGKWPVAITAAGGMVFYAFQAALSRLWLRHFRFGPVEWVWRSASYGKLQPFRKGRVK